MTTSASTGLNFDNLHSHKATHRAAAFRLRNFASSRETVLSARPALLPPRISARQASPPGRAAQQAGMARPADTGKGRHCRRAAGCGFKYRLQKSSPLFRMPARSAAPSCGGHHAHGRAPPGDGRRSGLPLIVNDW
jgi:hypothetical protein